MAGIPGGAPWRVYHGCSMGGGYTMGVAWEAGIPGGVRRRRVYQEGRGGRVYQEGRGGRVYHQGI